jgi:8-hydroxy-5-deazaflavin:NADPH oxidoreductase
MNIAIIGTGNVGGALATRWAKKGHTIYLGVQDTENFKGRALLENENTFVLIEQLGDVLGKTIIDATNAVMKSPEPYKTVYHCLVDRTAAEVVKCFNTTGFENMLNPIYDGEGIDMFMAGDSEVAKSVAHQLALDAGFSTCWDFGKADKVELLEKFALSWINLAIMQGHGRNMAFKVIRRFI